MLHLKLAKKLSKKWFLLLHFALNYAAEHILPHTTTVNI